MENDNKSKRNLSRRKFLGSTATVAAFSMIPINLFGKRTPVTKEAPGAAPNSSFGGVQMGAITYSWRSMPGGVENIIKYCKEAGISSVELMSNDVEEFLGAPPAPQRREKIQEQKDVIAKYNQDMKVWRLALPMSKFDDVRKLSLIHISEPT